MPDSRGAKSVTEGLNQLGEVSVDVYADLTRLDTDFNRANRKTEQFSRQMQGTVGKASKEAARQMNELDRATESLARSYSPLHAAQIRYARDLEKIGMLQKANVFSQKDAAFFTEKATAAYKRSADQQSRMFRFGQMAGEQIRRWGPILAAGAALGAVALVKQSLDMAKAIDETSKKLGVSTNEWQQWQYVAQQTGVKASELEQAFENLQKTVGRAAAGSERESKLFARLGIGLKDSSGQAKSTAAVMSELADGLGRITDKNQRAGAAAILLGENYAEIMPALEGGSDRINELSKAAERLGLVLSPEQIKKAAEAKQKFEDLQTVLSHRIAGTVADNADSIVYLTEKLSGLINMLGGAIKAWREFRLEAAIRMEQNTIDGWFSSDAMKSAAQDRRDRLQSQLDRARGVGSRVIVQGDPVGPVSNKGSLSGAPIRIPGATIRIQLPPARPAGAPTPKAAPSAKGPPIDVSDILAPKGRTGRQSTSEGPEFTQAMATAALRRVGIQTTSGQRSYATQKRMYEEFLAGKRPGPVAPPGASAHQPGGYKGQVAVDVGRRTNPNATPGQIKQALEAAGAKGVRVLNEGHAYHVTWAKKQKDLLEIAEDAVEQENRFRSQMGQIDSDELQLRLRNARSIDEIATIRAEQINRERDAFQANIEEQAREGQIGDTHAKALKAANEKLRADELAAMRADIEDDRMRELVALGSADVQNKMDWLAIQRELARTTGKRRDIELQLLDLEDKLEMAKLDEIRATSKNAAEVEAARRRSDYLIASRDDRRRVIERQNQGPVRDYFDTIPQTADEIADATERIRAARLEETRQRSVQFADDVGDAFGNMARSVARLESPLQILDNLLQDLAATFTEETLVRPVQEWARNRIGAPLAERVTGAPAGDQMLWSTTMNTAAVKTAFSLDALQLAATQAAQTLAMMSATGGGGAAGLVSSLGGMLAGAGSITASGAARLAPDVAATIAANPAIFHEGGRIGPGGRPIRARAPGEVDIRAQVDEYLIPAGPARRFGPMLDSIRAGRMPDFGAGLGGMSMSKTQQVAINVGGITVNGTGNDRADRRSGKQAAAALQREIRNTAKGGIRFQ